MKSRIALLLKETDSAAGEEAELARVLDQCLAEMEAGRKLSLDNPDATADLVPAGWIRFRNGKPPWPAR